MVMVLAWIVIICKNDDKHHQHSSTSWPFCNLTIAECIWSDHIVKGVPLQGTSTHTVDPRCYTAHRAHLPIQHIQIMFMLLRVLRFMRYLPLFPMNTIKDDTIHNLMMRPYGSFICLSCVYMQIYVIKCYTCICICVILKSIVRNIEGSEVL